MVKIYTIVVCCDGVVDEGVVGAGTEGYTIIT
jgi:hypothetical protein